MPNISVCECVLMYTFCGKYEDFCFIFHLLVFPFDFPLKPHAQAFKFPVSTYTTDMKPSGLCSPQTAHCALCARAGGVRGSARLIYSSSLEWRHTNLLRPNVVVATKDVCRAGKNGARGRKSEMDAVLVSSTQTKTRKVWWTILESVCLSLRGMCGRI